MDSTLSVLFIDIVSAEAIGFPAGNGQFASCNVIVEVFSLIINVILDEYIFGLSSI